MRERLNDIEVSSFRNNNVNDNEAKWMGKILNADRIADDLVRIFNSPGSRRKYCDFANRLPENVIRNNVETALAKAKSNPGGYFNRLCTLSLYKPTKH